MSQFGNANHHPVFPAFLICIVQGIFADIFKNRNPLIMRLGQLARKLALRPSEIVEFLAAHDIPLDESSNTRLEDDHVMLIVKHFAPAGTGDSVAAPVTTGDSDSPEMPFLGEASAKHGIGAPVQNEETEMEDQSPASSLSPPTAEEVKGGTIKAPKVELLGLKVVGKIDLPEPKKKEPASTGVEPVDTNPQEGETKTPPEWKRPLRHKKERTEQRMARKNPIALEREREGQEAEQKRKARASQEKEQRTKNYYKKVKPSAPTKRIKMVDEPTIEMTTAEWKEAPRTWVGRFLNWLKS